MPTLPTDGLAAAQFVVRHLCRSFELAPGKTFVAAAETEHPLGGDDWLWTDDNAKLLEFMSRPEIWRRFPREPVEMLRFVAAMCQGPFIFRRVSAPRLERVAGNSDDGVADYVHSLMHVRSDPARGAIRTGIRFHDGRTADNLMLGGNVVEFTHRRRRYRLSVAEAIGEVATERRGHLLLLRHSAELHFEPRWRRVRLGRITYAYTIDAGSMLIGVEAMLEVDSAVAVSDVVLTIGHEYLSHGINGVRYNTLAGMLPSGPSSATAGLPAISMLPIRGASYYAIAQSEIAGFALAAHTLPREPGRLAEIEAHVREPGWLHLVLARYRFDGSCRGATLAVAEDKMLTAGGFYDRPANYCELMRSAVQDRAGQSAVVDYSVSYDYGAEINAFAKCFAVAAGEDMDTEIAATAEATKQLFDTYLQYYGECFVAGHYQHKNTIMSRQLAFVIMGLATMYRATGAAEYLAKLQELNNVLLDFEVRFADVDGTPASAFPYGIHSQRAAWVDGHSAALLALTLSARHLNDPRLIEAIDRGIASYCLETSGVGPPPPHKFDGLATAIVMDGVPGHSGPLRHIENSYWNFNVGLALRFFHALRASDVPALQAIAAKYRDRIELFELVMRRQIARSITERGDALEIRTSIYSGETNSETQPWVMLGLLGHPYD